MKRRIFLINKLCRDKVVTLLEKSGSKLEWKQLSDVEFDKELRLKLQEETQETIVAQSPIELTNELADVLEVIITLAQIHNISFDNIVKAQEKKNLEKGGFQERIFVIKTSPLIGSADESYLLKDPQKYPEIFE